MSATRKTASSFQLAAPSSPTSDGRTRPRSCAGSELELLESASALPELPCAHCRELTATVFLLHVDASGALPFAGEVCERCAAELAAEQEAAR